MPRGRPRDPALSKRVEAVTKLLAEKPELSRVAACREVGGINADTYKYRIEHATEDPPAEQPVETDLSEVPVFFRDYSHLDKLHVFPLGDIHKGAPNHDRPKWLEWCNYVEANDHVSFLGTGDFLNAALKTSVSDVYEEEGTVRGQKKLLAAELEPIAEADRLDILIPGNHEYRVTKATGDCPIEDVAWKLGVNYAPASCMIVYQVGDVEYEVYLRHGSGSGRAGAQASRMERAPLIVQADVYVNGHTHRQQVLRGVVFVRRGKRLERRRQVFLTSGSLLNYEDYAAKNDLPPADLGVPRLRLDGRKKDVHASV